VSDIFQYYNWEELDINWEAVDMLWEVVGRLVPEIIIPIVPPVVPRPVIPIIPISRVGHTFDSGNFWFKVK
jgi:hypothetical protein